MSRRETWTTLGRTAAALLLCAGLGALVVGLLALIIAPVSAGAPPTCNGHPMHHGDRCWTSFDGKTQLVPYEQMVRSKRRGDGERQLLVAGGALVAGGVLAASGSWWVLRRRPHR